MSLLDDLYPSLRGASDEGPIWQDPERPWEILSNSENGIISQIIRIIGSEEGVFIHPTATIGDFVEIEGPCYIGPGVEVRHCAFLRRGSWLCEGSLVGHSTEIKNSILLPRSKAPHFNYVGDSIIGSNVNLGAGTKLSNVRNDKQIITVRWSDGSRIDTGMRKLGALIGDDCQLGCNVVTNPGVVIRPGSLINPNRTISGWND